MIKALLLYATIDRRKKSITSSKMRPRVRTRSPPCRLTNKATGTKIQGAHTVEEFISKLKTPRKIVILVKAGPAVDALIQQLTPHLQTGDIVIDGGNSHYPDSIRRAKELESKGLLFIGTGVSGGEEGARYGPSLMPGGSPAAWPHVKEIFQKVAAQAFGEPCCDWVGETGSGHYVKMVHNGNKTCPTNLPCHSHICQVSSMETCN